MNSYTNMLNALATRRKTVRKFKGTPLSQADILRALDTACQAPSGSNTQPWRFLIINDPAVKSTVRQAAEAGEKVFYETISDDRKKAYHAKGHTWKKAMLEKAPVLIVVAADTRAPNFQRSTWLAVGYLVLALEAQGLGSVTYTPSDAKKVATALKIPVAYSLEAILPVGYPADPKPKYARFTAGERTYLNQWENSDRS